MPTVPSGLALNMPGTLSNQTHKDCLDTKHIGITKVRIGIPDYQNAAYIAASRAAALIAKSYGLYVIYGVSSNSLNDGDYAISVHNWSDYVTAATTEATWAQANGIDEFQIGNEEEVHNFKLIGTGNLTNIPGVVALFNDGFESNDKLGWSSVNGDGAHIAVAGGAAALVGSYGLSLTIADTDVHNVQDDTPATEKTYQCRFYIDPNSLAMANADEFLVFQALSGAASAFFIKLQFFTVGGYKLWIYERDDSWAAQTYNPSITDAPHYVEISWKASTAPGANSGTFAAWVDGVSCGAQITGIDNDTLGIDTIKMGVVLEVDAGTSGTFYMDAFYSNNTGVAIGATDPPATGVATCNCVTNHNMVNGDTVTVLYAAQAEYNGAHVITRVDDHIFTYTTIGTPASPATGAIQAYGMTDAVLQTNLRALVVTIEGVFSGVISYATHPYRIFDWISNLGNLDLIGFNIYGCTLDPTYSYDYFKYAITKCMRNFGNKFYLSEFNISPGAAYYGTETQYADYLANQIAFITKIGLPAAYFFSYTRGNFAVLDSANQIRAAYWSLFGVRKGTA